MRKANRHIVQAGPADCGFHCVSVVAESRGLHIGADEIKSRYGGSTRGLTIRNIRDVLCDLGFSACAVRFQSSNLGELSLPAIVLCRNNHFVVIEKIGRRTSFIYDPESGPRKISTLNLAEMVSGFAIEVSGQPDVTQSSNLRSVGFRPYFANVSALRPVLQLLFLAGVVQGAYIVLPILVKQLFDSATFGIEFNISSKLLIAYVAVSIFALASEALRNWGSSWLTARLNVAMSDSLMNRLLEKPLRYFEQYSATDFQMKFVALDMLREFALRHSVGVILNSGMTVVALILMLKLDALVTILALATLAVSAILTRAFHPVLFVAEDRAFEERTKHTAFLQDVLESIQAVAIYNVQDRIADQNHTRLERRTNSTLVAETWGSLLSSSKQLVEALDRIAFLSIAVYSMGNSSLTLGGFLALSLYREMFRNALLKLFDFARDLSATRIYRSRIDELYRPESVESADCQEAKAIKPQYAIEIRDVTFRYSAFDPAVLKNFSLHVHKGESVAVVGETGCGKTTLVKLLIGLLRPESGSIIVNGKLLNDTTGAEIRSRIGCVMQSDCLLTGTIKENIRFFRDSISDRDVTDAAEKAQIHKEIMAMPMQYETIVSDRFGGLSGGQRQRVLIARALCAEPDLVVLDESTSNLDVTTERNVVECIRSLKVTRLVVAHRPETINSCDRVVHLQ